jgi:hypothetical protein
MEDSEKQRVEMKECFAKTIESYKAVWGENPNPQFWSPDVEHAPQISCLCIQPGVRLAI